MPLGSGSLVIADRNTDQRPSNCAMGVLGCRCLLRCITRRFCSGAGTLRRQRGDAWIGGSLWLVVPGSGVTSASQTLQRGRSLCNRRWVFTCCVDLWSPSGWAALFPCCAPGGTTDTSSRLPYFLPLCLRWQPSSCVTPTCCKAPFTTWTLSMQTLQYWVLL